jgi:hypothetical protein
MSETWADRRGAARRQPAVGTVYRVEKTKVNDAAVGLVWNISASGLSMLLPESRDAGDVLRGRLATFNNRNELAIELQVSHVRQIETGDYFVGGQFDHRLSDEELRPFLI